MKVCSKCRLDRPDERFLKDERNLSGLQSQCKDCINAARNARRAENSEAENAKRRLYYSNNKDRVLANNQKSKERNYEKVLAGKRAYYQKVREKPAFIKAVKKRTIERRGEKREYDKKYRDAIPADERTARAKAWAAANPEKRAAIVAGYTARRRQWEGVGMTGGELAEWIDGKEKSCHWCDAACESDYHVDHVMPLSKGGAHEKWNLAIACPPCNLKKNAKHPLDWLAEIGYSP